MQPILIIYGVIACVAWWIVCDRIANYLKDAYGWWAGGLTFSIVQFLILCVLSGIGYGVYYGLKPSPKPEPPDKITVQSPTKVTLASVMVDPKYQNQALLLEGYFDPAPPSCPSLDLCTSALCDHAGCLDSRSTRVSLMIPRKFYAAGPKKEEVRYRTDNGHIVGFRDLVQLTGVVRGATFFVQTVKLPGD